MSRGGSHDVAADSREHNGGEDADGFGPESGAVPASNELSLLTRSSTAALGFGAGPRALSRCGRRRGERAPRRSPSAALVRARETDEASHRRVPRFPRDSAHRS